MVTAGDVHALLADRPELVPAVEAVLAADEPFAFADLSVDSGRFGELVSQGVVEKTSEGEYRVADRGAVRQGLEAARTGDTERETTATGGVTSNASRSTPSLPSFSDFDRSDKLTALGLLAGLLLVVAFRLTSWPAVFRDGHVVLSGNDPYYYRFLVEQLVTDPQVTPSNLPGAAAKGEPLTVVSLWLVALLFGGLDAVGGVLAWYPPVAAATTGLLVYGVATLVTDDRRVGLASVLMLAVLPGHAMRTSMGFADHHAFDYVWLALTLLGVVAVTVAARRSQARSRPRLGLSGVGVATVALGVTGQVLAWEAGPLLVVPLGLYLAVDALRAVAEEESPLHTGGPVVLGVGIAAALTWLVHSTLGWHTTLVAAAPALVAVGGVGVLVLGEAAYRTGLPAWALAAIELVGGVAAVVALRMLAPQFWTEFTTAATDRLFADRAIAEVQSLFSGSLGWLLLFGLLLLIALPYLGWSLHRARTDARWLPLGVYGTYFLVLAAVQVRFVGQLSPVVAVFAGLAFVHVAGWADVVAPPAPFAGGTAPTLSLPDRSTVQALVVLFVLLAGLSVVQVPLKTNLVTTDAGEYETAAEMSAYSEKTGLTYPENYVLSNWGDNRVYNYFVSGESFSYSFAERHYRSFLSGTDGEGWYERLNRRGFVVTTDAAAGSGLTVTNANGDATPDIGTRLHDDYGSRDGDDPGLGHYRLVATVDDGRYKAFHLVPGAVVRGSADPSSTVTVETRVEVDGTSFAYTRQTTADADGQYSVRVAYPGAYAVPGTESRVTVEERAVLNGTTVSTEA
ncbi:STT3 domain-containing protein [Halomarina rubra]|uniref:dolichyl-phosphooligosaccharide-protein glycotransferase n=1 Tax=Halomarina rubra TaxID=2071873 RepID=A0ABD6AVN5_9EURY|nr:STT3 domain-containing protein [Halomarina rubra]